MAYRDDIIEYTMQRSLYFVPCDQNDELDMDLQSQQLQKKKENPENIDNKWLKTYILDYMKIWITWALNQVVFVSAIE